MSVEKIIQEAHNRNPVGLKETLEEELRSRVALALEAKIKDEDDDDDDDDDEDEDDDLTESKIGQMAAAMVSKGNANDLNDAIRKVFTALRYKHGITYPPEKEREMTKNAIDWVHSKNRRTNSQPGKSNRKVPVAMSHFTESFEQLDESATVDDFMKIFKISREPKRGTRMNLAGYPFDFEGYSDGSIELTAVDKDAAKNLVREFKKRKFDVERYGNLTINLHFDE